MGASFFYALWRSFTSLRTEFEFFDAIRIVFCRFQWLIKEDYPLTRLI